MRRSSPVRLIVHTPTTEQGRKALACRAAIVQAEYVTDALCRLSCPAAQKLALLDALIAEAKQMQKSQR